MNKILKVHTLKEIKEIAKDYKFCTVEDINGKSIISWNRHDKKISIHLLECIRRINAQIIPDGYYNFLFTTSMGRVNDPDKYLICKGKPIIETPVLQNNAPQTNNQNKNDIISVEKALNYISENAKLDAKVEVLTAENLRLKEEIEVLKAELDASEAENETALSEATPPTQTDTLSYLKEIAPTFLGMADKYFQQKDRSLDLEEKKLSTQQVKKQTFKRPVILEVGSEAHINLIKDLYSKGNESAMNNELNKLEIKDIEKYNSICNELNLFEDEN